MKKTVVALALNLVFAGVATAQLADVGQVNNEYARTDGALSEWATFVFESVRGPQDYQQLELGLSSFGLDTDVLGDMGSPFSLGDGGSITLGFNTEISNGPGDDLVVFENGFVFDGVYMELGFVEVSSNGFDFARLPAFCRQDSVVGPWGSSASELFYNLAGNFVGGTGIDLQDLIDANDPLVISGTVELDHINFVRIVDVIGDLAGNATQDHLGRAVADPYPTTGAGSGMDISGVAVINSGAVANESTTFGSVKSLFR